jgi:hypothetical protein
MNKEIVGILGTDDIIRTGSPAITHTKQENNYKKLISRHEAELMAAMDLGVNWEKLAVMPTLFIIDEDGNPRKSENDTHSN